eukprot:gene3374-biopygen14283
MRRRRRRKGCTEEKNEVGCVTSAAKEHTAGNYSVCTLGTDSSRPGLWCAKRRIFWGGILCGTSPWGDNDKH